MELNKQQRTTASGQLYLEGFKGLRRQNRGFLFKIQHVCRMYLAIFLSLKTNNQDCKQKKVDNQWKNKLKTFHGPFFTKHPIHFRRPQEFHSLVYTVYLVGKRTRVYNLPTLSPKSDPMSNFSWKRLVELL